MSRSKAGEARTLSYEWPFGVAALNRRMLSKRLQVGELSTCTGVDGRFLGSLKTFPGMSSYLNTGLSGVTGMWYVRLQKGTANYTLRGFLIRHLSGGNHVLSYYYYDEETVAQAHYDLAAITVTATTRISVSGPNKYAYIAIDGQAPQTMYWDAGTSLVTHAAMGVGAAFVDGGAGVAAPVYDAGTGEVVGGYLHAGTFTFAYRYYNPTRGLYTALSGETTRTVVDATAAGVKINFTNPDGTPARAYAAGYRKLQVFRTISAEVGGSSQAAGMFRLETVYDLDAGADCWPAAVTVGTLTDDALLWQDVYYPEWEDVGVPPQSGAVAFFDGVTFMGSDTTAGSANTQIVWSQVAKSNPEAFNTTTGSYTWDSTDGRVVRFVRAGDFLFVFTEGAAYRVAKSGTNLLFTRMHSGRSLVNDAAAHELGRDIFAVTDLGVSIFDGVSGAMQTIGALDRLVLETWVANKSSLFVTADAMLGCSFVVNPTLQDAAVVWHATGAVSMLEDCDFVAAATGPHPVLTGGGRSRAFFVTVDGQILYPDASGTMNGSMRGLVPASVTVNGAATAFGASTITMLTSVGWTTAALKGAQLYVWSAANEEIGPQAKTIVSVGGTGDHTITVTPAFSPAVAVGDKFTIAPVPFKVTAWPAPAAGAPAEFGRRIVKIMGVSLARLTGASGNANARLRMGMCRNLEVVPAAGCKFVTASETTADNFAYINIDGVSLEPYVEAISAGLGFELLAVDADVTISVSRSME